MKLEEILSNLGAALVNFATSFGVKLIGAILILVIGLKVVKWFIKLIKKTKGFQKMDPGAASFICSLLSFALRLIIILTAVATLGVPMTNFITILGSAGLAVGLAMQGSLSNLAGGLMILIFHPFRVGDFINANGVSGTVKEITILYTIIDTPDNVRNIVPNGELSNATVTNYSINDTRRVDLSLGVSYKSDLKQVVALLTDMAEKCPYRIEDKEPFVKIGSYDESQITMYVRIWTKAADYWTAFFELTEQAKDIFDANGIEIPYPQVDVHIDKAE